MTPRCASKLYWWDADLTTRCHRPDQHHGDHWDRLRTWNDHGLQTDGSHSHSQPHNNHRADRRATRRALDNTAADQLRRDHHNGTPLRVLAQRHGICIVTVYAVLHRTGAYTERATA